MQIIESSLRLGGSFNENPLIVFVCQIPFIYTTAHFRSFSVPVWEDLRLFSVFIVVFEQVVFELTKKIGRKGRKFNETGHYLRPWVCKNGWIKRCQWSRAMDATSLVHWKDSTRPSIWSWNSPTNGYIQKIVVWYRMCWDCILSGIRSLFVVPPHIRHPLAFNCHYQFLVHHHLQNCSPFHDRRNFEPNTIPTHTRPN